MKYKIPIVLVIVSALLFLQVVASDDSVSLWLGSWYQDSWKCIKLTQDAKTGLIKGTYSGDPGGRIFNGKLDADGNLVGKWSRNPTASQQDGGNLKLEWIDEGISFQGHYDYGSGGLENPFGTVKKYDCDG